MKKGRKENCLRRMIALLLSAALIVCGGINPVHVLAEESISENTAEVTEESALEENPEGIYEAEEIQTESGVAETVPEDMEETVPGETATEGQDGEAGQEAGSDTISGTDWTLDSDGKLTIRSDEGMEDWRIGGKESYGEKVVSVEIQDGVTNIRDGAFGDCSSLTSIVLSSSVTSIGESAFYGCNSLIDITIPDSVVSIGPSAFGFCGSLISVTLPDRVASIGELTFHNCGKLTSIKLPSNVTNIGGSAFRNCRSLTDIIIPSCVTSIEGNAFYGCTSLKKIVMQGSIPPTLGGTTPMFQSCKFVTENEEGIKVPAGTVDAYRTAWPEWENYITDNVADDLIASGTDWTLDRDGKLTIWSEAGMAHCIGTHRGQVINVEIKDGVTSIKTNVFEGCNRLTSIMIPDSVTSIGAGAFSGCNYLKSVAFPPDVTSVGKGAFKGCSSLTDIALPDSVTDIGDDAFNGCASLKSVTLPSGVTGIGTGTFSGCSSLASISLPPSVTSIGDYAFKGCRDLMNITFPSGVTTIGVGAFEDCIYLVRITLPPDVTTIGAGAFKGCIYLVSITLPYTVTSIGCGAFLGCSCLKSVIMRGSTPPVMGEDEDTGETHVFDGCKFVTNNEKGVMVPLKREEVYKEAWAEWADYITDNGELSDDFSAAGADWTLDTNGKLTIWSDVGMADWQATDNEYYVERIISVEVLSGVTSIGGNALKGCSSLTGIEIPDSVASIEESAFEGCSSLTGMEIPDSVTSVGESAFEGCSSLTGITLPPGVTSIEDRTFYGCSRLTGIEYSSSLISIGDSAFFECFRLADIKFQAGLKSIGDSAFSGCRKLIDIKLPSGVAYIGDSAFSGCSSLKTIIIPSSVTSIGNSTFYGCSSLTGAALGFGLTSIGDSAFAGCRNLISISIPSGVTSIGNSAFCGCAFLLSISIPPGVKSIGSSAFSGCRCMTKITLPFDLISIGDEAFFACSNLESVTMLGTIPPTLRVTDEDTEKSYVFYGCKFVEDIEKGIKVPWGTEEAYKAAWPEWADYITDVTESTDREKVFVAQQAVEAALPDIPVSNVTTQESLETAVKDAIKPALTEAGVSVDEITIAVENFSRNDATIKAVGSISASIRIASGTESASVPVSKTIEKLAATPADKVALAKTAVENAVKKAIDQTMAGTAVTNENAEEFAAKIREAIPAAVEEALAEVGVSADEVTAGEAVVEIRPATADSEGSINITIPLTSGEDAGQSASATVQAPIAKPDGEDDPDKDAEAAQKMVEDALKELTVTNDTTPEDILAALREKLGDRVTIGGIDKFEKADATEAAAGNIILSVKVIMNGKTMVISTTVSIPIVQIDKKTGLYVRFTDYYDMDGSTPRYKYTGQAVKPAVEVYNNGTRLLPDRDYTVGYKNNTKVGAAAALLVKGKGNFSGTSSVINFVIGNADIDKDTKHPIEMTVVVNEKVAPIIMNGTKKLTTKDFQLEGYGLANGKYELATGEGNPNIMTVKGIGCYAGSSFEIKVRVMEKSAAKRLTVEVDRNFKPVYNGSVLSLSDLFRKTQDGEGAITVRDAKEKTKILREGVDFTVLCTSSCLNAGTANFTVTGMGEYTGSVNKSFKISPIKIADSNKFSVAFDENKAYEYKASGTTVDNLVVKYLGETDEAEDDRILRQGVDYKVTYNNNRKVSGTKDAGFKVTFLGNYKGSGAVVGNFKVVAAKLSAANTDVIIPDKVYTRANRAYKSTPIVTVDGAVIKASNYTVSYAWTTGSEAGDDTKYVSDNKVKITLAEGDTWAKVRVTVTPKQAGSYALAEGAVLTGEYYVRKSDGATDLSKAKVTFLDHAGTQCKTLEYNGNPFYTPAGNNVEAGNALDDPNAVYVKVTVGGAVVDPGLYDVIWTNATKKGRATVVIRGKGIATEKGFAVGSKNQTIHIKAMALDRKPIDISE